jgi:TonB family protein
MNRSLVIFFLAVLLVVIVIARHNSKPLVVTQKSAPTPPSSSALVPAAPTASSPAPIKSAQLTQDQSAQFRRVAAQVAPAMTLISVFDSSGRLLRNGTGFFVSENGRLVTSQSVVEGGANAIAKTSDGRIHNVSGILAGGILDLVVLKAEPKQRVPFLVLSKTVTDPGAPIAVIGNPLTARDPLLGDGKISKKHSDPAGESLELSMPIPSELGSPAVNENGEVIGVVTQGTSGAKQIQIRSTTALNPLLAQIDSGAKIGWQVASLRESPPPAEGPAAQTSKMPLAGPQPAGKSRLIYSPSPGYPKTAGRWSRPVKGSGRFRVTFSRSGEVKNVAVIESTRNAELDNAAVDALRRWKAQPGQEWTANVPITFQP